MSETNEQKPVKTLTLGKKLDIKRVGDSDSVRQSFSHGKSRTVAVEVKKKRVNPLSSDKKSDDTDKLSPENQSRLNQDEIANRLKAVQEALKTNHETSKTAPATDDLTSNAHEEKPQNKPEAEEEVPSAEKKDHSIDLAALVVGQPLIEPKDQGFASHHKPVRHHHETKPVDDDDDDESAAKKKIVKDNKRLIQNTKRVVETNQVQKKLDRRSIARALNDEEERGRSIASLRRARQKQNRHLVNEEQRITREVIIPDTISVAELSNRMAIRSAEVIKSLMKSGMMVTVNQVIDGDTAELVCSEFGHKVKRVSDTDIELGIKGDIEDTIESLRPRAPVVTIMGHVDHGKTSLLDALRETDVVSKEAGGITQHIGAYQVTMKSGQKITFIDTPGHAAFSEMRARGANITDVVVLVVAADDGIKDQTIEAINHVRAASVNMIIAINKIDKPGADPQRVKNELLNHGVVLEEYGGDTLCVEVSAKQKTNLEKLEETILLQAEVLDLKSNPNREAQGVVIESKIDKGRGNVATILVQKGTLRVGDIFVAGQEWGKVRALISDHGQKLKDAGPSVPVEILGFNGSPLAGDEFHVVDDESRAREVAEYRERSRRDMRSAASVKSMMDNMMTRIAESGIKNLAIVIKSDVQGSTEAIVASLHKLSTDEVSVRVLHSGVGGINESDVALARASNGIIFGFNVRANPQARDLAKRDGVDIRYYSIIYDLIDDVKALMGGLLSPTLRETYLGNAEIREVFNITKVGKIAGCFVIDGTVKRGAKVRLLRDDVVIHEGTLRTLKRFKDEVKEVREGYECGMAFENYQDIRQGDIIECFDVEHIARTL